jgi:hypothetical protein
MKKVIISALLIKRLRKDRVLVFSSAIMVLCTKASGVLTWLMVPDAWSTAMEIYTKENGWTIGITATVTIITSKMALISKVRGSKTLSLAPATKSGPTKPLTRANITMARSRVRALSAGPTALSTRVTSKTTTYTGKAHINGATEEAMMADGTLIWCKDVDFLNGPTEEHMKVNIAEIWSTAKESSLGLVANITMDNG